MNADAYKLGYLDAALDFGGTKESWAKAIAPLAGAALGAIAAPEGETMRGALAGGGLALAGQSALLAGARHFGGKAPVAPGAPPAVPPPAAPPPAAPPAPAATTVLPKGAPVPTGAIPQGINAAATQHGVDPQELYQRRMQQVARPTPQAPTQAVMDASKHFGTDPHQVMAMKAAPGPMQGAPRRNAPLAPAPQMDADLQGMHGNVAPPAPPPPRTAPQGLDDYLTAANAPEGTIPTRSKKDWKQTHPAGKKEPKEKEKGKREKKSSLEDFKIAVDMTTSMGIPGTPFGVGIKDQRERLPGMSRWVPRSTIERGFDHADEGMDADAVEGLEADRGSVAHPLLGAALAAAGARKFMPQSGVMGPLLGGLVGGGLGALYNQATRSRRVEEGLEAFNGAQREREKFPIRRHPSQTANESAPLAVSRGSGDA